MGNLETEIRTYEEHKAELLEQSRGRWVLIHGQDVIGLHDTELDAAKAGWTRFKTEAFLVRQVLEKQPVYRLRSFRVCTDR